MASTTRLLHHLNTLNTSLSHLLSSSKDYTLKMGFLQTIPATTLTASYLTKSQTLRLEAKGDAQNYTGGIAFHRMPWAGGLLFKLEGWVGPVAMGWTPYDIVNDFKMDLPNPVMPSNIVLIDTLEGRKEVPIVFEPPLAKNGTNGTNGNGLSARVEAQSQPPESKALDGQKLTVLYKEPFNIVSPAPLISLVRSGCRKR